MRRGRFSEVQIFAILKDQDAGMPTADVCRRHGISSATYYKWKAKFGGLEVSEATRAPMAIPQGHNQRWLLDFVSDAFACARRFRIFTVVDDFTREFVRLIADTSISGLRVARELDWAITERARPAMIVSDNGIEFNSMAILRWSKERDVEWHYIAPGKPQQDGVPGLTPESMGSPPSYTTSGDTIACQHRTFDEAWWEQRVGPKAA
jgi:transposase InsO family protein